MLLSVPPERAFACCHHIATLLPIRSPRQSQHKPIAERIGPQERHIGPTGSTPSVSQERNGGKASSGKGERDGVEGFEHLCTQPLVASHTLDEDNDPPQLRSREAAPD